MLCDLFVAGAPKPQPRLRPRVSRRGVVGVHMPKSAQGWRDTVMLTARHEWGRDPLDGPLWVDLVWFLPRPRTGPNSKPEVEYHTAKPDVDNLTKSTLDALNGVLWRDDAQVCMTRCAKVYVTDDEPEPGVMITVRRPGRALWV